MSIIQPPTRGIQSVQTQQITAAAGKCCIKPCSQLLNASPNNCDSLTEAAITAGSTGDSKVYLRFKLAAMPAAVSSSVNHPENGGEGSSSVYKPIISEQQNTAAAVAVSKTGLR